MNFNKYSIILSLVILFIINCSSKTTIWQGKYIKIETKTKPKEDFKVGDYIIVSYAPVKYENAPQYLYEFAVILNGRQIRLINLEYNDKWHGYRTEWCYILGEEAVDYPLSVVHYYLELTEKNIIYQLYKEEPAYEQIKKDVSTILSGGELIPNWR